MSTNNDRVASALEIVRVRAGLTQEAISRLVGLTQKQIAEIESGDRSLSVEMASELAKALCTNPWELLADQPIAKYLISCAINYAGGDQKDAKTADGTFAGLATLSLAIDSSSVRSAIGDLERFIEASEMAGEKMRSLIGDGQGKEVANIAALGFAINSSQARSAVADLDKLSAAGDKAGPWLRRLIADAATAGIMENRARETALLGIIAKAMDASQGRDDKTGRENMFRILTEGVVKAGFVITAKCGEDGTLKVVTTIA